MLTYASEISERIEGWGIDYLGTNKLEDLKGYLRYIYPRVKFNADCLVVTYDALINKTGLELMDQTTMGDLNVIFSKLRNYFVFTGQMVAVFIDPDKDVVHRFKSYLFEKELTRVVWVVKI